MSDDTRFQRLFKAHAKQLAGRFRRRIAQKPDAADLSQEVFLRLLRVNDLEAIEDPQSYLFTMAENLLRERYHTQGRHERLPRVPVEELLNAPELSFDSPVEAEIDTARDLERLRAALGKLSARDREVLTLLYRDKLSYREIARRWGVTKSAVEKAVTRATVHCRQHMTGMETP